MLGRVADCVGVAGHHEHVEIRVLPEASIPSVPEVARTQLSLPSCPHVIGAAGVSCLKAQSPGPVRSQISGWRLGLSFAAVCLILPPPPPAPRDRARPLWGARSSCRPYFVRRHHAPASGPVQSASQAGLDAPVILDQGTGERPLRATAGPPRGATFHGHVRPRAAPGHGGVGRCHLCA